jgi:hypothetical protein
LLYICTQTAKGDERVDYIPGISPTRLVDLPLIDGKYQQLLQRILIKLIPWVAKTQSEAIDVLKAKFPFPVYSIGPTIPYFELGENNVSVDYIEWLDCQPTTSVVYISIYGKLPFTS